MALMRGLSAGGTWRNCRAHGDGQPVFDDLRRRNGVDPPSPGRGAAMQGSGTGLYWRSRAPSPADVSLESVSGD